MVVVGYQSHCSVDHMSPRKSWLRLTTHVYNSGWYTYGGKQICVWCYALHESHSGKSKNRRQGGEGRNSNYVIVFLHRLSHQSHYHKSQYGCHPRAIGSTHNRETISLGVHDEGNDETIETQDLGENEDKKLRISKSIYTSASERRH